MAELKVITTRDGSSTIYHQELNETYHSMHGAVTESKHVFIENGLQHFITKKTGTERLSVFEVGLGTGLNAVLAATWAEENKINTNFESIEAFPLNEEIVAKLNYFEKEKELKNLLQKVHHCSWNEGVSLGDYFTIKKIEDNLNAHQLKNDNYHVVFYDAFAPSKQPEMWDHLLLEKVVDALKPDGIFVTYCAKGQLKRDLQSLGCNVETLPGPPGKKEMVRATKTHTLY